MNTNKQKARNKKSAAGVVICDVNLTPDAKILKQVKEKYPEAPGVTMPHYARILTVLKRGRQQATLEDLEAMLVRSGYDLMGRELPPRPPIKEVVAAKNLLINHFKNSPQSSHLASQYPNATVEVRIAVHKSDDCEGEPLLELGYGATGFLRTLQARRAP